MQGPSDESDGVIEGTATRGMEKKRPRPPGGKALIRQLQLLESAGYLQLAIDQLNTAVSAEGREEAGRTAEQFSAAALPDVLSGGGRGFREGAGMDGGAANVEKIGREYMQVGEQLGPPSPAAPLWRSLGPWTVPNGQTYGTSRVNISGRVSAIAVDPKDPAHVLAAGANGGVWESHDRGASWAPRTDYAATLTVGALVFDPQNSSIVYCGTGEGNWWSWLGAGILRSTDGGATWAPLCTAPFVGQGFYDLCVDPQNGSHLLAATNGGLYVSTDGGQTWAQRRSAVTWSLSIAPSGGPAAEILAACSDGLWSSNNGGTSWTAVPLPGKPATFDRFAVAIAPSKPAVAYAWGAQGSSAFLWRRSASTWSTIGIPPGARTGQAWYDWYLVVAPDRDTQIFCGAIDVHRGDLSGKNWTWVNLSTKAVGDSVHPDQHAIAFEPGHPDNIYVGNDGGLFFSPDRGNTWQHRNNGLVISEFEYLAHHPGSPRWLVGGTQDNGTERWLGSNVWEHVADGDGGDCGVNRANPTIVFHTFYDMDPESSSTSGDWNTWTRITPPVPSGEGSLFYPPFECSATTGDTIAMGGDSLYISRDNGASWQRLAFPSSARSSALYIPNSDAVYVGTTDGRIFCVQWSGSAWPALSPLGTPRPGGYISDLYVDPQQMSRVWVTLRTTGGGRIFRSDDGGGTWVDRSTAALPSLPINAIEVDPENGDRVWVAADLGVYQSTDGGASWADFSNGLPHAFVGDLVFHPQARLLRAGTRNRGVWEIPVDGEMTAPVCGVQFTGSLVGNQTQSWFTHSWPASWHVIWTVMPTTVRPGSPQVSWKVQVERSSPEYVTYWISVTNLTPDPLDFEGRYCILSRY